LNLSVWAAAYHQKYIRDWSCACNYIWNILPIPLENFMGLKVSRCIQYPV